MGIRYVMVRDTGAWRVQVWLSFAVSVLGCGWGVLHLPGQELDRAFLAIALLFSLFASFALAKTIRDNRDGQVDTQGWILAVWVALAAALSLTAWGLWRMTVDPWLKNYMALAWLFLVTTSFSLAKTLRDSHEAELMERGGTAPSAAE
jgi:hypothetical protein